jgi:hypothetical protein
MKPIDNIDMRKIDLEIKKDESLYAQCNFCFSIKETFSLKGKAEKKYRVYVEEVLQCTL